MRLSIENDEKHAHLPKIKLDGQDISTAIQGLTLDMQTGSIPFCRLDLRIYNVTELQDVSDKYLIPQETQDLLKLLGWTPPHEGSTFQVKGPEKPQFLEVLDRIIGDGK
jgi:hypothetical protein